MMQQSQVKKYLATVKILRGLTPFQN